MAEQWKRIKQNKPAIFDWLVFTISLVLGLIFPTLKDLTASASFSAWMLVSLVLYVAGLWLKHRPVYYRLAVSGKQQKKRPYLLFLIIGHWIIMLAVIIIAEEAFRNVAGMKALPKDQPVSGVSMFTTIVTAAFVTWLAFRPVGKNRKQLSEIYLFRRELAGDILLISGVAILSFVFWEKSLLGAITYMPQESVGEICMLFIFLSVAYLLFYLPLRYLYLIEDQFSRQTWKRLLFIFFLILVRGFFSASTAFI